MVADMTVEKKKLKNNLRQIIMEYIQDHAVNSRIPSERDISAALDINRYSIRKHLAAFEREGWISKNGRQGMFLCSQAEIRDTYGLITGDGHSFSYLDGPDMIAGALRAFSFHNCMIRNLSFSSVDQIPGYVQRFGLKGIIWMQPNVPAMTECFSLLLKKQIPLVFGSDWEPDYFAGKNIDTNVVTCDVKVFAMDRVRFLAERSCRHAACLAVPSKERDFIAETMRRSGIVPYLFSSAEEFMSQMPDLIRKHPIDAVLSNGHANFYQSLFQFLHSHPDFQPVLSIEDHPQVRVLMKQYPEIPVDFNFEPWQDWMARIGAQSAEMLLRSASDKLIQPFELAVHNPKTSQIQPVNRIVSKSVSRSHKYIKSNQKGPEK